MKAIKRVIAGGAFAETLVPSVFLIVVAIAITIEAILRYAFSYAILGLEEVMLIIGLYVYFLGSACASRDEAQIRVSIIDQVPIPALTRHVFNTTISFIAFVICGIYAYYSFLYVQWTVVTKVTIPPLNWPHIILGLSMLLGLTLMALHHLTHFIEYLRQRSTSGVE